MRVEHLIEGLHPILEQVKAVGDLRGLGCPVACPIGIGSGPIARDDLHPWMRLEPLGQGLGLPIGHQGDRLPTFQSDQHCAIALAFTEREIVHP
jgi:hypothetical protein